MNKDFYYDKDVFQSTVAELKEFLKSQELQAERQTNEDGATSSDYEVENFAYYVGEQVSKAEPCVSYSDYDNLKDELKTCINHYAVNETLFDLVEKHLKETGMKPSEVYKNAQISKQDFSRYIKPKADTISRTMVFNLAIGLKLDLKETKDLLKSAGYGFNKKNKFDLIIMFCINKKLYDVTFINLLLDEFGQPLLITRKYREK